MADALLTSCMKCWGSDTTLNYRTCFNMLPVLLIVNDVMAHVPEKKSDIYLAYIP